MLEIISQLEKPWVDEELVEVWRDEDTRIEVEEVIDGERFIQYLDKIREELSWVNHSETLDNLLDNHAFFTELNKYIFSKFPEIYENPSFDSYKEVHFFIYLLSARFKKDFFDDWNIFSIDNFSNLFDVYIEKIENIDDLSNQQANSYLLGFTRLCGLVNLICNLSQNDNFKRWSIKLLTSLIVSKINDLLLKLKEKSFDDSNIINALKYTLWLLPLNFSYIHFIEFNQEDEKWLDDFLLSYKTIFDDTINWYFECENSNFWDSPDTREKAIKKVSFINLSYIVSLIIFKLKNSNLKEEQIIENQFFKEIIENFLSYISKKNPDFNTKYTSLKDIINICNQIFIRNYNWVQDKENSLERFLELIIQENHDVKEVDDLEILHHLILFNDLDNDLLIKLFNFLHSENASSNINFEVIKIKIYNIILTKLSDYGNLELKKLLSQLTYYIDKNKVSSHLLFVYSLLYATIWYCYSFFEDSESHLQSIENYAKFRQINPWNFDFSRYGINMERFYQNIWVFKFKNAWKMWDWCEKKCKSWLCRQPLSTCMKFNADSIISIWEVFLEDSFKNDILQRWNVLLNELDTFLHLQEWNILNMELLTIKVSKVLSNIFHWVADIQILSTDKSQEKNIPKYYKNFDVVVGNSYILRMIYPNIFSEYFENIYKSNSWENTSTISLVISKLKLFFEKYNEENKEEISVINDFERAFEEGRIKLFHQWIYTIEWIIEKFEVLTRVDNPIKKSNWKDFNIREYIDISIKNGRKDLLRKLIKYTVDFIKENSSWEKYSINMEYLNMVDEETIWLFESLKDDWFNVSLITIELIEWKWENDDVMIRNIRLLKQLWFKIAMDDFWSWESSLNRLQKLLELWLLDYVKIDWRIVENLSSKDDKVRKSSKILVKAIVDICRVFKVHIIAEYVENQDLLKELLDLEVTLFQWYHFWKPTLFERKTQ